MLVSCILPWRLLFGTSCFQWLVLWIVKVISFNIWLWISDPNLCCIIVFFPEFIKLFLFISFGCFWLLIVLTVTLFRVVYLYSAVLLFLHSLCLHIDKGIWLRYFFFILIIYWLLYLEIRNWLILCRLVLRF